MKCLQLLRLLATCITASIVEDGELGDIYEYRPGMPIFGSSDGTGPIVGPYKVNNDTENSQLNYSPVQLATNLGSTPRPTLTQLSRNSTLRPSMVLCWLWSCGGSQLGQEPNRHGYFPEVVVLFKTSNSDRDLMHKKEFDSSYTELTTDGAEWLARNTNIKLVGIDYLSVAVMHDREPVYLLMGKDIIPLEGFNIGGIHPGEYTLRCLPLGISDASEAPTRCILIQ